MLQLGEKFPNFQASTTEGSIDFYEWKSDSWAIIFSHPADFTPVCTTELSHLIRLMPEFAKRKCKVIAMSCDSLDNHRNWMTDLIAESKMAPNDELSSSSSPSSTGAFPYPIIADESRLLSLQFEMLDFQEKDAIGIPLSARTVFMVSPDNLLRCSINYPATTGRNFNEILRVLDSMQLCDRFPIATPVNWKQGDDVCIQPTVTEENAKETFPSGCTTKNLPSGKQYLRTTSQPN